MGRPTSKGAEAEVRVPERFIRLYGNGTPRGHGFYAPTPRDFSLDYVGPQRVPRLWKPGLAGWASLKAPHWPPDEDHYPYGGNVVPHIRARTVGRNDTRAVNTGAVLRPATLGRIPPVLVPRARFSK